MSFTRNLSPSLMTAVRTPNDDLQRWIIPVAHVRPDRQEKLHGCDNILDNLVITPHRKVASCCGLTFEHIPEMKLSTLGQESLRTYYDSQLRDFLKIWLWVEGPENILLFAASKDPQIEYDNMCTHTCEACAVLHLDPRIRSALQQHYHEKVSEVMFRYFLKRELKRRTQPGYSVTNGETYMLSGASSLAAAAIAVAFLLATPTDFTPASLPSAMALALGGRVFADEADKKIVERYTDKAIEALFATDDPTVQPLRDGNQIALRRIVRSSVERQILGYATPASLTYLPYVSANSEA